MTRPVPAFGVLLVLACARLGAEIPVAGGGQATLVPETRLRIVAFGDSLTSGHRLPSHEAYPAVLEATLRAAGLAADVINHGRSGDTTAGGLRRLTAALDERPDILIVAFGANDGLRGVPVSQVRSNLDEIVTTARSRGVQVLLVGMEALPIHGLQYTLDFHTIYPGLASKHKVPLVPFMLSGVFGNPELMSEDQVHPNAAGARVMAATIWTYLRPLAEAIVAAR